jgi:hypothetical protein
MGGEKGLTFPDFLAQQDFLSLLDQGPGGASKMLEERYDDPFRRREDDERFICRLKIAVALSRSNPALEVESPRRLAPCDDRDKS